MLKTIIKDMFSIALFSATITFFICLGLLELFDYLLGSKNISFGMNVLMSIPPAVTNFIGFKMGKNK